MLRLLLWLLCITACGARTGPVLPVEREPLMIPSPAPQLALGAHHTCKLARDGVIQCIGPSICDDVVSVNPPLPDSLPMCCALGYPCRTSPTEIAEKRGERAGWRASRISSSDGRTCALLADGTVRCWGRDAFGLGSLRPETLHGVSSAVALGIADRSACILSADRSVSCVGTAPAGSVESRLLPGIVTIAVSHDSTPLGTSEHLCALDLHGSAWCWGSNDSGQLGDGTRTDRPHPVHVAIDTPLTSVVAGGAHTCAIDRLRRVWCWGRNTHGQLGTGDAQERLLPLIVYPPNAQKLALGAEHTCVLRADGVVACWGANGAGQLGVGIGENSPSPTIVPDVANATEIGAGWQHTCALATNETIWCWGRNDYEQLGVPAALVSRCTSEGVTFPCSQLPVVGMIK